MCPVTECSDDRGSGSRCLFGPIALIGFMGSGKTSVGRHLAERLGVAFVDADAEIEARAGRSIASVFAGDGEAAFRALEHATIQDLLEVGQQRVLALGGGAAMHTGTRQALRERAVVVHLRVSLDEALRRVGADPARPVLARPDLAELHAERTAVYDRVADLVVDVDRLGPEETCARLANALDRLTCSRGAQGRGAG